MSLRFAPFDGLANSRCPSISHTLNLGSYSESGFTPTESTQVQLDTSDFGLGMNGGLEDGECEVPFPHLAGQWLIVTILHRRHSRLISRLEPRRSIHIFCCRSSTHANWWTRSTTWDRAAMEYLCQSRWFARFVVLIQGKEGPLSVS